MQRPFAGAAVARSVLRSWRLLVVRTKYLPPLHGAERAFGAWLARTEHVLRNAAMIGASMWRQRHEALRTAFVRLANVCARKSLLNASSPHREALQSLMRVCQPIATSAPPVSMHSGKRVPERVPCSPMLDASASGPRMAAVIVDLEPPAPSLNEPNTAPPTPLPPPLPPPPSELSVPSPKPPQSTPAVHPRSASRSRPLQSSAASFSSSDEDLPPGRARQWQLGAVGYKCWQLRARSGALRLWWLRTRASSAFARRAARHEAGHASRTARAARRRAVIAWRAHCDGILLRTRVLHSIHGQLALRTTRALRRRALTRWSRYAASRTAHAAAAACAVAAFEARQRHRRRLLRRGFAVWSARVAATVTHSAEASCRDGPAFAPEATIGSAPSVPADRERLWTELRQLRAQIDSDQNERRSAGFLERLQLAQLRQQHELLRRSMLVSQTPHADEAAASGMQLGGLAQTAAGPSAASRHQRLVHEKARHAGFASALQHFARRMQL